MLRKGVPPPPAPPAPGPAAPPPRAARRRLPRLPFNVVLVLPAQITVLSVVLVPTAIVIWLALTDWQPTQAVP